MQLEEIQIPVYFGGFIDVFWDSDGIIRVDTERDRPGPFAQTVRH